MTWGEIGALALGGLVAGVINTLAGGGSMLTVPLLVLMGLPGPVANATNRVGVLVQNATSSLAFQAQGVRSLSGAIPILIPSAIGAVLGATIAARMPAELFERLFGVLMLVVLVPLLRRSKRPESDAPASTPRPAWLEALIYFGIGVYGGAFQIGVGILFIFALAFAGMDLVRANSIKVIVVLCFTAFALPVFILSDLIVWPHALALALGFSAGGALGARVAVLGGDRVIRPIFAVAVVALAGRMIGLY